MNPVRLAPFARLARAAALLLILGSAALPAADTVPIGAVQGSVPATLAGPDAAKFATPMDKQMVAVQGVVTQRVIGRSRDGKALNGFYIQNTKAAADKEPASSDGIYVFMGKFTELLPASGGKEAPKYAPEVGDEVILRGQAKEFYAMTQLDQARLVQVVRKGVALDAELETPPADPPADAAAAAAYWEKLEGMRVALPAGLTVQGHSLDDSRMGDRIAYVARPDRLPNAAAGDPYAQRVFRDAHPLDNVPNQLFDDGNGYRFLIGSAGLRGTARNIDTVLPHLRGFSVSSAPATAIVSYTFDSWVLLPGAIEFKPGLDPSLNNPPQEQDRAAEFTVASFNIENLYDRRDDPTDANDFHGNPGERGVKPPFNYVPETDAAYQAHVAALAKQIAEDLHAPDVILVQEAEDQDIAVIEGEALKVTGQNNADGKPDTVQELTLALKKLGLAYDCAFDRDGADNRGIVQVFMWRTDLAELMKPAGDPLLGSGAKIEFPSPAAACNAQESNPKALNAALPASVGGSERDNEGENILTRAAQALGVRVWSEGVGKGKSAELIAVNNHFSSRPNARVEHRRQQAAYNAAIYQAFAAAKPAGLYLMGGDLNIYPRPDDPFADKPSDQLGSLYEAGLANLWDTVVKEVPAAAYSYVFDGQAQTLDQMFVSPALGKRLVTARYAHINCEWPEGSPAGRAASDHDPLVARFRFE